MKEMGAKWCTLDRDLTSPRPILFPSLSTQGFLQSSTRVFRDISPPSLFPTGLPNVAFLHVILTDNTIQMKHLLHDPGPPCYSMRLLNVFSSSTQRLLRCPVPRYHWLTVPFHMSLHAAKRLDLVFLKIQQSPAHLGKLFQTYLAWHISGTTVLTSDAFLQLLFVRKSFEKMEHFVIWSSTEDNVGLINDARCNY